MLHWIIVAVTLAHVVGQFLGVKRGWKESNTQAILLSIFMPYYGLYYHMKEPKKSIENKSE